MSRIERSYHPRAGRIFQALVAVGVFAGCAEVPPKEMLAVGEEGFGLHCAQCHYDGRGEGQTPSLFASPMVKGPPEALIDIIFIGQSGKSVVAGKVLGGIMPPQDYLEDQEIAEILTYVRYRFGGSPQPTISPEDVAARRLKPQPQE